MFSKFGESYFKWAFPLKKYELVPDHSLFHAMTSCLLALMPDKFYERIEEGSIIVKKSQTFSFCKNGVIVDGESSPIETDLVILATGYKSDKKIKEIFASPLFQNIVAGSSTTTVPLYRSIYAIFSLLKLARQ